MFLFLCTECTESCLQTRAFEEGWIPEVCFGSEGALFLTALNSSSPTKSSHLKMRLPHKHPLHQPITKRCCHKQWSQSKPDKGSCWNRKMFDNYFHEKDYSSRQPICLNLFCKVSTIGASCPDADTPLWLFSFAWLPFQSCSPKKPSVDGGSEVLIFSKHGVGWAWWGGLT